MHNRYIGNTGDFYRVNEPISPSPVPPAAPPPGYSGQHTMPLSPPRTPQYPGYPPQEPHHTPIAPPPAPAPSAPLFPGLDEAAKKTSWGKLFGAPDSLRTWFKGILPDSIDIGDIILVLVLFYLFVEGGDDEMLIILGVLLFTWIAPLFKKEKEDETA